MNLDPHSGRISWNPTPDLALQVSHGYLKSPEGNASPARTEPDAKRHRTTASLIYNKSLGPDSLNAISIGYVRDLFHGNNIDVGLGGQVTLDFWPGELDRYYGGGPGYGFQVFLRVRPSLHSHPGL